MRKTAANLLLAATGTSNQPAIIKFLPPINEKSKLYRTENEKIKKNYDRLLIIYRKH